MKNFAFVIAVLLAGCLDSGGGTGEPATALDYDAHFVALIGTHPTPEDCLATEEMPFVCRFSISLCKNGRAGYLRGDIVSSGTYNLEGNIAHITFTSDGSPIDEKMDFDVVAPAEIGAPQAKWIVDTEGRWNTLQFDNISCD